MNINTYANKGLTGLVNLGNTCYLNSCMQILSHCYILNEIIEDNIKNNSINDIIDSALLIEWNSLRKLMWQKNCIISPNRFVKVIQNISQKKNKELFTGFVQNDFPEFLIFILDCFHNSLKKKVYMNINGKINNIKDELAMKCYNSFKTHFNNNYSDIINNFYGIQVTRIVSMDGSKILSNSPEPYCLVSLSLDNSCNTIYDCLDKYCEIEYMTNENAWFNEKTNNYESIQKNIYFWSLPEILVIDLKRFNNNLKKIEKLIDVPLLKLDMSKYVIGYDNNKYIYELFGISNHIGSTFGGHYTSYIKNANNNWYEFNDQVITKIKENKVITNNAYCFFFIKKIINNI